MPQSPLPPTTNISTSMTTRTATTSASPPPGHRATALNNVFNTALTHTLQRCSYANFSSCFPTLATYVPTSLYTLWAQTVQKLENYAKTEYATILRDRGVVPALNDLDTLIAEAYTRKSLSPPSASSATTQAQAQAQSRRAKLSPPPPPAPHTLLPSTIAQAHLLPFLTQQRSLLNARIQTVGAKNEKLADEVRVQREEIERLVGGLEAVVRDLDGANEVLAEGAQGLREESRAVEKDIKSG